jgi:hypothetical protein
LAEIGELICVGLPPPPSQDDKKEERKCPKCGAVWKKTEPTLAQVRQAVVEVYDAHRDDFAKVADDVLAGYCGSVARGTVGNPDKVHYEQEPDIRGECGVKYDIDGFILSKFARKIRAIKGKHWGSRHPVTRKLEKQIRADMAGKPALAYMLPGSEGYSILVYPPEQADKLYAKQPIVLYP